MSSQSGYEQLVESNPNPLGTCFCGVLREDCPGGPGYLSPNEIEGVPGNYGNFITVVCARRLGAGEGEALNPAEPNRTTVQYDTVLKDSPAPHVNPVADSLEEAQRLIDAQAEARALEADDDAVI